MNDFQRDALDAALLAVLPALNALPDPWFVMGSYSLRLHGLPVACDDIDVVVSEHDAERLRHLWSGIYPEMTGERVPSHQFRSVFSRLRVGGCRVEVMGGLAVNTPAGWQDVYGQVRRPVAVSLHGNPVLVPSLSDSLALYRLFGRPKDAEKIRLIGAHLSGRPQVPDA